MSAENRWSHFKSPWHLVDLVIIVLPFMQYLPLIVESITGFTVAAAAVAKGATGPCRRRQSSSQQKKGNRNRLPRWKLRVQQ